MLKKVMSKRMMSAAVVLNELKSLCDAGQRDVLIRFFKTGRGEYGYGDRFLGVKVPQVRAVVKRYSADCSLADVERLVASPFHEVRLTALLVLCRKFRLDRANTDAQQAYVDFYLAHVDRINNWDLVDLTAYELLGAWLLERDRSILYELAAPDRSLWANRIAIVATMQFVRHGQFEDTLALAEIFLSHPHDLMHKATGWLLREVGKRDRLVLEDFLASRYRKMPRTMLRYAIERFPESVRIRYLKGRVSAGQLRLQADAWSR